LSYIGSVEQLVISNGVQINYYNDDENNLVDDPYNGTWEIVGEPTSKADGIWTVVQEDDSSPILISEVLTRVVKLLIPAGQLAGNPLKLQKGTTGVDPIANEAYVLTSVRKEYLGGQVVAYIATAVANEL